MQCAGCYRHLALEHFQCSNSAQHALHSAGEHERERERARARARIEAHINVLVSQVGTALVKALLSKLKGA